MLTGFRTYSSRARHLAVTVTLAVACCQPALAQNAGLLAEHQQTLNQIAAKMNDFAAESLEAGSKARAVSLWRTVLEQYNDQSERAREALGFVKRGPIWRLDGKPPRGKDTIKKRDARKLDRAWKKLVRELVTAHTAVAEKLEAASLNTKAALHWKLAYGFDPKPEFLERIKDDTFEGLVVSPEDFDIVRQGRRLHDVVSDLIAWEPVIEALPEDEVSPLVAGMGLVALKAPHCNVYGDLDPEVLMEAARYTERTATLFKTLCADAPDFPEYPQYRNMVFFKDRASYHAFFDKHAQHLDGQRLQFFKDSVSLGFLETSDDELRVYSMDGKPNPAMVNDYTVRGMSQDVTRTLNIGLWEGIGHAAVGWFFDRTLTYTLDLSNANTVAGNRRAVTVSSDMASWVRVANEMAWEGVQVPAARIPLLKPDSMKVPERVKAWSLIDYVFRRQPQFYFALEKTTKRGAKGTDQVSAAFKGQTRMSLEDLDEQWRTFWAKGEDIRATMRGAEQRNEMPVRREINALRREAALPLLGARRVENSTAIGLSTFVPSYMKAVKRRAKLMEESPKKAKEVVIPVPPPGEPDFVVAWSKDPKVSLERLLASPGCRDVLINPYRLLVSLYVEKEFVGCDLRPLPGRGPRKLAAVAYPFDNAADVPCSVELADLGDTLGAALLAAAADGVGQTGYPITLHTFAPLPFTPQGTCAVRAGDQEISGRLILPRAVTENVLLDRRVEAPGMFVFLPDEPLPSGARISVEWVVPTLGRINTGFETR